MNRWLVIRLVITALSLGSGLNGIVTSAFSPGGDMSAGDWRVCGIIFGAVAVIGFCAIGGGYQTKEYSSGWIRPSWYQNPFQARCQPLQGVHLVAVCAIAEGIGGILRELATGHYERAALPGICLAIGLGFWVALRLAVLVFHRKYASPNSRPGASRDGK